MPKRKRRSYGLDDHEGQHIASPNYFAKRYQLFNLYDSGIQLSKTGWYSVTPESVALKLAWHVSQTCPLDKCILIDVFAGAGGNTIAFAKLLKQTSPSLNFHIIAIEKNERELENARCNAAVYGVEELIEWIHGDCFEVLEGERFRSIRKEAIIFASPPWGGPGYRTQAIFDLSRMEPYSLATMYQAFAKVTKEMVVFLPRSSNLNQVASMAEQIESVPVIHYSVNQHSIGLGVYYGNFINPRKLADAPTTQLLGLEVWPEWAARYVEPRWNATGKDDANEELEAG